MNDVMDRLAADIGELLDWASFPREEKELADAATALSVHLSRLEAARALVAGQLEASGFARREAATSTRVWLRERCHISIGAAHRTIKLGGWLGGAHLGSAGLSGGPGRERLLNSVAAGDVTVDQALVIGEAVARLPRDMGMAIRAQAEATLIGLSASLTPAELEVAGERILDLIAPEVAEEAEARRLADLDKSDFERREFHIRIDHTGAARLTGRLDAEATARLRLAIEALARPLPAADGTHDPRSAAQRNADALHELARRSLDEARLPDHGASRPQLLVTIDYQTLARCLTTGQTTTGLDATRLDITGLDATRLDATRLGTSGLDVGGLGVNGLGMADPGAGTLDTGVRLSPETVRRLACDAQIIPAILGTKGELLDLGRSARLISGALRTALIARDRGCTFPGCDRPPRWCTGHHVLGWAQGGPTSLDNAVLLCPFHHRTVHNGGWTIVRQENGRFAYIPPPHIDPQQRPRVNTIHRRT